MTEFPKTYAIKHINDEVRKNSRSGGIFTAISDFVLSSNGVVYGCILNEDFEAVHVRATTPEERNLMRGSKYIQSKLGTCFKDVKKDLEDEKFVLFSGTLCQISGLKSFLKKEYNNLLTVDILCHGVPSLNVWRSYLKYVEKCNNGKVVKVDFRNKIDYGWASHVETIWIKKGKKVKKINSRIFRKFFYGHMVLRPSCYRCPYRTVNRISDITIGDFWGIDKAVNDFNDNKGVSLVLLNNGKGEKVFNEVSRELYCKETLIENALQLPLCKNPEGYEKRKFFWEDYKTLSFDKIVKKHAPYTFTEKLKDKIKVFIKNK